MFLLPPQGRLFTTINFVTFILHDKPVQDYATRAIARLLSPCFKTGRLQLVSSAVTPVSSTYCAKERHSVYHLQPVSNAGQRLRQTSRTLERVTALRTVPLARQGSRAYHPLPKE